MKEIHPRPDSPRVYTRGYMIPPFGLRERGTSGIILAALALIFATMACEKPRPEGVAKIIITGSAPNDAIIALEATHPTLIVAASLDSAVQFFDLNSSALLSSLYFPPNAEGKSPNPWALSASQDARYLAVALYDDHAVALVDIPSRTLLSTARPNDTTLKNPVALEVVGSDVYVLFANLIKWAEGNGAPSQYGAGTLTRFRIADNQLVYEERVDLPCVNPSDLAQNTTGQLVVSCTGSLFFDAKMKMQLFDGAGLVTLDKAPSLKVASFVAFTQFSPAKLIARNDGVFLSSSVKRQLLFVPAAATVETESLLLPLDPELPDESGYLPSFVVYKDNIAFVADFMHDHLIAVDLDAKTLNPAPFVDGIHLQADPNPLMPKGPVTIVPHGDDLHVLMTGSNEVLSVSPAKAAGS